MFEIIIAFDNLPCSCRTGYTFQALFDSSNIFLIVRCKKCNIETRQNFANTSASTDLIKNFVSNKTNIRQSANILEETAKQLQVALDKLETEGKL